MDQHRTIKKTVIELTEKIESVKLEYDAKTKYIFIRINNRNIAWLDINALLQFEDLTKLLDPSMFLNLGLGEQIKTTEGVNFENDKVKPN